MGNWSYRSSQSTRVDRTYNITLSNISKVLERVFRKHSTVKIEHSF